MGIERQFGAPRHGPERLSAGDAGNPRFGVFGVAALGAMTPSPEHGLLGSVLGGAARASEYPAGHAKAQRADARPVPVVSVASSHNAPAPLTLKRSDRWARSTGY